VISRPTTQQLLDDAARELRDKVLPAVSDPGVQVVVQMLEQLVRSCGVRAANEIAWMRAEEEAMIAYAEEVATAGQSPAVASALAAYRAGRRAALTLDDVCADYDLAGAAMSAALSAAMAGADATLGARAQELMTERMERETIVRGEFSLPGRG
jgi:hypothetical protein